MKVQCCALLLSFTQLCCAGRAPVFDIHQVLPAPAYIIKGRSAYAEYQVKNQQTITLNNNGLNQAPKGVSAVDEGQDSCKSPFTLQSKASCRLVLALDGSKINQPLRHGPRICHRYNQPLFCSDPRNAKEALHSNIVDQPPKGAPRLSIEQQSIELKPGHTSTLSITNLSSTIAANNVEIKIENEEIAKHIRTTVNHCRYLSPQQSCELTLAADETTPAIKTILLLFGANTHTLSIKLKTYAHYALISTEDGTLFSCKLDSAHDKFDNCEELAAPGLFNQPQQMAFNDKTNQLYLSNQGGQTVSLCQIDLSANHLSCTEHGSFHAPLGLALTKEGSEIYVGMSAHDSLEHCQLNTETGHIQQCRDSGRGQSFDEPGFITIFDNKLYVTHQRTKMLSLCQLDEQGRLTHCGDAGSGRRFSRPSAMVLNPSKEKAYLSSRQSDELFICDWDKQTGFLSDCQASDLHYPTPSAMAIDQEKQVLYLVNQSASQLVICPLDEQGIISACEDSQFDPSHQHRVNSLLLIDSLKG